MVDIRSGVARLIVVFLGGRKTNRCFDDCTSWLSSRESLHRSHVRVCNCGDGMRKGGDAGNDSVLVQNLSFCRVR